MKKYSHISASFLLILLLCTMTAAVIIGEYQISLPDIVRICTAKIGIADFEISRTHEIVFWRIRVPRILLGCIIGMAMSVSGTVYQACFRNPLVEPYILGVSSGAAWGAALAIVFPAVMLNSQLSSFCFALLAVFLSFFFARRKGETPPIALILSGIIVAAFFSALVGIMKYFSTDSELREITFWMMGGLYYADWSDVRLCSAVIIPCFVVIFLFSWKLNVLSMGDEEARSLGVHPDQLRFFFLLTATLMASTAVSCVGIIAWVGLMMPHAARLLFGQDNRWVIPCSAILGSVYILICDTIARSLFDSELPIGIVISLIGAPYLLCLLRAKGKELYAS